MQQLFFEQVHDPHSDEDSLIPMGKVTYKVSERLTRLFLIGDLECTRQRSNSALIPRIVKLPKDFAKVNIFINMLENPSLDVVSEGQISFLADVQQMDLDGDQHCMTNLDCVLVISKRRGNF